MTTARIPCLEALSILVVFQYSIFYYVLRMMQARAGGAVKQLCAARSG